MVQGGALFDTVMVKCKGGAKILKRGGKRSGGAKTVRGVQKGSGVHYMTLQ